MTFQKKGAVKETIFKTDVRAPYAFRTVILPHISPIIRLVTAVHSFPDSRSWFPVPGSRFSVSRSPFAVPPFFVSRSP